MNKPNLNIYKNKTIFHKENAEGRPLKEKNKLGRKLKYNQPMDQKITVNFTKDEKKCLEKISLKNHGVPITSLIRNACKHAGII